MARVALCSSRPGGRTGLLEGDADAGCDRLLTPHHLRLSDRLQNLVGQGLGPGDTADPLGQDEELVCGQAGDRG